MDTYTQPIDELQDVTVKVPTSRILDFYAMYGRWLGGEDPPDVAPVDHVGPAHDNRRRPWDPYSDLEVAIAAWKLFPDRARALFATLMDNPGQKYSGEQLAKLHDIPHGVYGVAGVLSWPGRYLVKLGRELHFQAEPNPEGGSFYWMEPEMADLFRRARDAS